MHTIQTPKRPFPRPMATVIIAIVLVGVAVVLLGVRVLFVKGGKFPNGHAHANPELRRRGAKCPSSDL